jgi:hypothetical protein
MNETMMSKLLGIAEKNEERASAAGKHLKFTDMELLKSLVEDLQKPASFDSIRRDPYWHKWDSPWWKISLIAEIGYAEQIPHKTLDFLAEKINSQYLTYFPIKESELPQGCDPYRDILCHCAYGNIFRIFYLAGYDPDKVFPDARKWFFKYQLPDGGLNCDESSYTKDNPSSSFLSTLPPLEAVLFCTKRKFTDEEQSFLEKGNQYLIRRKIFKSIRKGMSAASPQFFQLLFPRFYEYDILRGLHFVVRYALAFQKPVPVSAIIEAAEIIDGKIDELGLLHIERSIFTGSSTIMQMDSGKWEKVKPAPVFPLLEKAGAVGSPSVFLTKQWYDTVYGIIHLNRLGLLSGSLSDRLHKT